MELTNLLDTVESHFRKKQPFVLYALPDAKSVNALFQQDNQLHTTTDYCERGVIMAPFKYDGMAACIPESHCEKGRAEFSPSPMNEADVPVSESEEEHQRHLGLVTKALRAIRARKAHKIVVSRKKEIAVQNMDLTALCTRLLELYPTAYRYVWYRADTGLWCGASPEILLKTQGAAFTTMSLAGTHKVASGKEEVPKWTPKEIAEQQMVTDAIATSLQKVTSVVKISKASTFRAGSLAHIRTDITGVLKTGKATLETISAALHPTPAVCGTPVKAAQEFIAENEGYQREYYTGFTGPINLEENSSSLFVNLRCMKIEEQRATLYVGGGITADSDAEQEWVETHNKLQTMLQVLRPLL
jgi:isochorismate synthase